MAGRIKIWAALGISLAVLLFFYIFILPGIIKQQLISIIAQGNPGYSVTIGGAAAGFPLGVRLSDLKMEKGGQTAFEARKLNVHADIPKLCGGSLSLAIDSALYGGRLKGSVDYEGTSASRGPAAWRFTFENIKADECGLLRFGKRLTGKLSGFVEMAGEAGRTSQGKGRIEFTLVNGTLPFSAGSLGIASLPFEKLEGAAVLDGGIMDISRMTIKDKSVNGSFQGRVSLDGKSFAQSRLWLQGHLTFSSDQGNRQTVIIAGTVSEPSLSTL